MTQALQALIAAGESLTLELSKSPRQRKTARVAVCARWPMGKAGKWYLASPHPAKWWAKRYQRLLIESMHATDRWEMQPAIGCGIDTPALPVEAVREALANAAGSVSVALYDDRLEYTSVQGGCAQWRVAGC